MQIQTVRAVYSGSVTRKLTFTGIKPVIVSGDMDATIIEFSIPSQYDGFNRFIEWNVQIKDTNGKYVYPLYEITDDRFTVPHEITYFGNGKEASFSLILTNGDVVEKSIPLTVPVIWASDALELHDGDDFKKIFNAFVSAIYHTGEFTDETYSPSTIEFTTVTGSKYILNIPLPYLDENHKIMWRFIPEIPIEKIEGLNEALAELSGAIMTETSERKAADTEIAQNLTAEIGRAKSEEKTIADNLAAEVNRAITAEQTISDNLTAEVDRATASEQAIADDLTAEVNRAKGAEQTNAAAIANEVTRAKAEENRLNTALTDETTERKNADTALTERISTEESTRESADNTLQDNIDAEATARASADASLRTDLNAEITARTDKDAELSGAITTETSERKSADSTLQSNIDNEASTRASADSTLQSNIDSEESARIAGDNALQTNINNEASARASADSTLQSNIDAEESARIAGDNALQTSKQDTIISRVLTIPQTGWTDKVQVLTVSGLTEEHRIIMTYELSSSYIATLANVQIQSHTGGSITFVCDDTPTGDVLVDITVY